MSAHLPSTPLCNSHLQTEAAIRVVGLSHSMADAKDVGDWLGTTQHATFNFTPGVQGVLGVWGHGGLCDAAPALPTPQCTRGVGCGACTPCIPLQAPPDALL